MVNYRKLTEKEIAILENRGCSSPDWSSIDVAEGFSPDSIRNANIVDCKIDKNVYINNVFGELRNLAICEGSYIEAVYSISCSPGATFGFGHCVNVMSESGGRPVILKEGLTAQTAYIQAFYRHSALLSKKMEEVSREDNYIPDKAPVGPDVRIVNCGIIEDVWIAGKTRLEGVLKLSRGFIDKAFVGPGVIAEDFMICEGAKVTDAAHLKGVFVGECATVSAATVHDSLIFANSHIENGEVVASFLGPFSTSMHKSTLLIGGLFSFFNAGSGSNQSNHAYKLGPMHQGILQRGCKTGSDSYILWPAVFGAYTTILGRHYGHPDTRSFPFSVILNNKEGESILLPGAAAATVGFARDVDKWPRRDSRRELPHCDSVYVPFLDVVDYHWLSPFTVEGLLAGVKLLKMAKEEENSDRWKADGFSIPLRAIDKGLKIYKLLIERYIAETLLTKIQSTIGILPQYGVDDILHRLATLSDISGHGRWVDIAGMLAPKNLLEKLLGKFVEGTLRTEAMESMELSDAMAENIFSQYNRLNWSWLQENFDALLAVALPNAPASSPLSARLVTEILTAGANAIEEMTRLWEADAAKEFDPLKASLGFGIDAGGDRQVIIDDFARARGSLAGNKFLAMNLCATKEKAARMRLIADVFSKEINKEN